MGKKKRSFRLGSFRNCFATAAYRAGAYVVGELIALYDGDCGLCQAFVSRLARHNAKGAGLAFRASQLLDDLELEAFGIARCSCESEFILVDNLRKTVIARGAEAINQTLIHTGHPLSFIASTIPRVGPLAWIEAYCYRVVARNRRWISQRMGLRACVLR